MHVNKVINYPLNHFISYSHYVREEMTRRGYRTMNSVWEKISSLTDDYNIIPINELFPEWHHDTYWTICYYNLKEKWMCGGIKDEDWIKIHNQDTEWRLM